MKDLKKKVSKSYKLKKIKTDEDDLVLFYENFQIRLPLEYYSKSKFQVGFIYNKDTINSYINIENEQKIFNYTKRYCMGKNVSEVDVKNKLLSRYGNENYNLISSVISDLKDARIIDNFYYVDETVERLNSLCYGKKYIINYLFNKKITEKLIKEIKFDEALELKKAQSFAFSLVKKYKNQSFRKAKDKMKGALLRRGFDDKVTHKVLLETKINEKEEISNLKKDYVQLRKKYGYDGASKQKIIGILHEKGYIYSDIEKIVS